MVYDMFVGDRYTTSLLTISMKYVDGESFTNAKNCPFVDKWSNTSGKFRGMIVLASEVKDINDYANYC